MKKYILLLLFPVSLILSLQVEGQNEEELKSILRDTDTVALNIYSSYLRLKSEAAKQEAWNKAAGEGWVTRMEMPGGAIMELMRLDDVGNPIYYTTTNANSVKTVSTQKLYNNGGLGLNLTGTGMVLREWDGGAVRANHQELTGRVTQVDGATSQSDHSTHVAGTMMASGVQTGAKGMAYQATLRAFEWTDDFSEMASEAALGALVSNHSYGLICGWYNTGSSWVWYGDASVSNLEDYKFGYYDEEARTVDSIAFLSPNYLVCKSAGNDRGNYNGSGPQEPDGGADGFDCISSMGTAKNILTIGAVNDIVNGYGTSSDVVMSTFSGWGPTDDGRIKPDIVANGISLYSCFKTSNTAYGIMSGTSMSSPSATGSIILLQQHFNNLYSSFMKSATLKALAIHSADEAGNSAGPDYSYGWGLLNTAKAAQVITQRNTSSRMNEVTLNNGSTYTLNVNATGNQPLRVTICWTDRKGTTPPKSLNPSTLILVNDLDLRVNGTIQPWILNPANPAASATTGDNFRDNVEQVYIANPTAGNHIITVTHKGSLSGGSQAFSIIVTGVYTGVAYPAPFTAIPTGITTVDLSWTKNTDNNNVIIAWSSNGIFGTPVNGTTYNAGNTITGGGTVIYNGNGTQYQHSGLTSNTAYYYRIWSYNSSVTYSSASDADAVTLCNIVEDFPYNELFPTSTLPSCWKIQQSGYGTTIDWNVNNSANAGGTAYEMRAQYVTMNPGITRLITPAINTVGMTNLTLTFKHLLDDYGVGATLKVQSSSDGIIWVDEGWSMQTSSNTNKGPYTVNLSIVNNLNKPATRLAFVITGNLYQYDYWYIDNVSLKSAGFWMGGTTGFPTDWNTATNWGDDLVPSAVTNAVIPLRINNPVVNNDPSSPAVCNDLIIYDGATVTVNPGKKIIINGKLELKGAGQMN